VIRFLIFLLGAFLLGIMQSTLVSFFFPPYLRPDLLFILVIFLGIHFPLWPGAVLALFCGLLYDTFSAGVLGLFSFVYLCTFFSLKTLAKFLIMGESLPFRITLVAVLTGFQALLLVFLPMAVGVKGPPSEPLLDWLLPQVLVTCAACWPFFRLFRRLDIPPEEETSPPIT
jgi:rod shape-determining protein MreD